jgi:hypothetical protein
MPSKNKFFKTISGFGLQENLFMQLKFEREVPEMYCCLLETEKKTCDSKSVTGSSKLIR